MLDDEFLWLGRVTYYGALVEWQASRLVRAMEDTWWRADRTFPDDLDKMSAESRRRRLREASALLLERDLRGRAVDWEAAANRALRNRNRAVHCVNIYMLPDDEQEGGEFYVNPRSPERRIAHDDYLQYLVDTATALHGVWSSGGPLVTDVRQRRRPTRESD